MNSKSFEFAPTAPCDSSACSSIAVEVIGEVRAILSMLPTGEWRRSLKERLVEINGAVEGWNESDPSPEERKRVTAAALNLFAEAIEPQ
jgi:hypothetical protein